MVSQFLWYNNTIKVEDVVIHLERFCNKNIDFSSQLFENGRVILQVSLKNWIKIDDWPVFSVGWAKTRNTYKMEHTDF